MKINPSHRPTEKSDFAAINGATGNFNWPIVEHICSTVDIFYHSNVQDVTLNRGYDV